jgi:ABC-2 type transport system permease protein
MTVFKTFLKVLNKCKIPIIMYTVFLIGFGGFNMATSETSTNFEATKPDILIVNNDENIGITNNLIEYLKNNCKVADNIKDDEDAINDALFYREISYIVYIPEDYRQNSLNGEKPEIKIKTSGDYEASYAEMLLTKYIKVFNIYIEQNMDEDQIISSINDTLKKQVDIEITSKLDTNSISRATFYYNFASYSLLAGAIYVICLVLASFNDLKIKKRTIISSMNYKKHNRLLLFSNGLFALVLWLFYIVLSFVLIGETMFTTHGLIYIINSLVFTICTVTIAFLINNIVNDKNAINGIVNVVALGSSFLSGAFVPVEMLPNSVLTCARILPSYWYIQTNELLKSVETFNIDTLKPIIINMSIILGFSVIFIVIANVISKKKRKIA